MADARALFVGGTSSNAGKSLVVTAICAWLRRRGVSVAPFKAQNMSNHSYPCRAGGEIGRAQVAQAEACGREPEPAMNPILLKPTGEGRSQVVVNGLAWKTLTTREYYACVPALRAVVADAFQALRSRADVVIVEGAGSVSELNLREHDLVNLDLVRRIGMPWLLVADIERGGVFGSIIGTEAVLTPAERSHFRGFLINKFRGDATLFDSGVTLLEQRTGRSCFGVFPHLDDLHLDAEDSLAVSTRATCPAPPQARLAIVRLPHLSNATDFRMLDWADWIDAPTEAPYDFIIVPGTKSTIPDMRWLRARALDHWIAARHAAGTTIVGVCGGFQMLGRDIADPDGVESTVPYATGLDLLPVRTVLTHRKTTRVVRAALADGTTFSGYVIHAGHTSSVATDALEPFATLDDGDADGVRGDRVIGTYLHGAFESVDVCRAVFGVAPSPRPRQATYDRLADWFDAHVRHLEHLGLPVRMGDGHR